MEVAEEDEESQEEKSEVEAEPKSESSQQRSKMDWQGLYEDDDFNPNVNMQTCEYLATEISHLKKEAAKIAQEINDFQGDRTVIEQFKTQLEEYTQQREIVSKLEEKEFLIKSKHDELKEQRKQEFLRGFSEINDKLKTMFRSITAGGDASLDLKDQNDPFSDGVTFSVKPPNKSWKEISTLSGGEQTLSSLSLIFALHQYRPTPVYFMDEIDAALDYRNISIIANYIKT